MIIGFIGLGHMGFPMASQLLKHQFQVLAYDSVPESRDFFKEIGGQIAENSLEIAQKSDIVITMIPTEKHLFEIYHDAFIQNMKANTLCIDCSTIGPIASRKWHNLLSKFNIASIEAPVSGGIAGASSGTLTFMIGGHQEAINRATPILSAMGSNLIHTGKIGTGQAAKICNNLILACNMIAVSEAFKLAKAFDLPFKTFHEITSTSSAKSWVIDKYVPVPNLLENVPADRNYEPGFSCNMMLKDLKIIEQTMKEYNLSLNLTEKSYEIYQKIIDHHCGDKDFSYVYAFIDT